jgi:hypothetical protein
MCTVTIRRIKPGGYEAFRRAWEPASWWPGLVRAEVLRNDEDPNQVLTLGYFDASPEQFDRLRDDREVLEEEQRRLGRIAEYEDTVLLNTTFELVEEVALPAGIAPISGRVTT